MCGIACFINNDSSRSSCVCHLGAADCISALTRRGPDHTGTLELDLRGAACTLTASVLHLRGTSVCKQPLQDHNGNVLLWNGEVFHGLAVPEVESDTATVLATLGAAVSAAVTADACDVAVRDALGRIRGPYAMIFLASAFRRLYYARDPLARRSLLRHVSHTTPEREMLLCSVAPAIGLPELPLVSAVHCNDSEDELEPDIMTTAGCRWEELPASGIYWYDFKASDMPGCGDFRGHIGWAKAVRLRLERHIAGSLESSVQLLSYLATQQDATTQCWPQEVRSSEAGDDDTEAPADMYSDEHRSLASKLLHDALLKSVYRRVHSIPDTHVSDAETEQQANRTPARVAVLFSGGLDSVVLAAMVAACEGLRSGEPIDLINVCFDATGGHTSPDRLAAVRAWRELRYLHPSYEWRLVLVDAEYGETLKLHGARVWQCLAPSATVMDFNIGLALWTAARGHGRLCDPATHPPELYDSTKPIASIGSQRSHTRDNREARQGVVPCAARPCKRAAKHGCWLQLCARCCTRARTLVRNQAKLDLTEGTRPETGPKHESDRARDAVLQGLINDLRLQQETLSVQGALCLAHRDKASTSQQPGTDGPQQHDPPPVDGTANSGGDPYVSAARVLLVGTGADEQMAGYSRHRSVYRAHGYSRMRSELALDMGRLWQRNLGRDDRVLSDHGREARFPFLDEDVVRLLAVLPPQLVADLRRPPGIGDKQVLRGVASMLGLRSCQALVKRAIQFGSRIAREHNTAHGSDAPRRTRGKGDKLLSLRADAAAS